MFLLTHNFGGFRQWSIGPAFLGSVVMQLVMVQEWRGG